MIGHLEEITCPNCKKDQTAEVKHTNPFFSYVHNCDCGYIITESEWETSDKYKSDLEDACKRLA